MFFIDIGIKGLVHGAALGNGLSFREVRNGEKTAGGWVHAAGACANMLASRTLWLLVVEMRGFALPYTSDKMCCLVLGSKE